MVVGDVDERLRFSQCENGSQVPLDRDKNVNRQLSGPPGYKLYSSVLSLESHFWPHLEQESII